MYVLCKLSSSAFTKHGTCCQADAGWRVQLTSPVARPEMLLCAARAGVLTATIILATAAAAAAAAAAVTVVTAGQHHGWGQRNASALLQPLRLPLTAFGCLWLPLAAPSTAAAGVAATAVAAREIRSIQAVKPAAKKLMLTSQTSALTPLMLLC